jgi:hypothetical protein
MAIQQIEGTKMESKTGFSREIDQGAINLIFDTVQKYQYSYPFGALVQELTSNATDAVQEKLRAYKILVDKTAKIDDYYIEREGNLYKDSNFDPSYYDFKHLDMSSNVVELTYIENFTKKGIGYCDLFTVKDKGVGLGPARLEGYMSIGFSTKRNNNDSLGSFG